jgi:D-alanyl-D-alanine carboxypeptidase/D-alanyl-D-alanine-endopeptidase (penicillin-binding protein 4)
MEFRVRPYLCIVAALLLASCATTPAPPSAPPLAGRIDAAIHRPPFQHAFWSILVEEEDGRVVYSRNADKLSIPASNRKLFLSATAAECLGLDGQLVTEIWRDGDDLIVRGDGDPSLGSWRYERSGDFDALAATLHARGITRVRDVIADVSIFDRNLIPGSWKVGNLGWDYAAPVDALTWGENEIPVDRAVPDPAMHTANALREALFMSGIEITGAPRVQTEPRAWAQRVATIPSPFIGQLLGTVLKNSHNLYAEMLLKRLGGGSYDGGLAREQSFVTGTPNIDPDSFRFADGSGLSPEDLVTPEATVLLLRWMHDPVRRGYWWSTLAQPANEGTLRRRLAPFEQRLRGKTGTISGVAALSGILAMPDGRVRYFAIVVNHHPGDGDGAVKIIDEVVGMIGE